MPIPSSVHMSIQRTSLQMFSKAEVRGGPSLSYRNSPINIVLYQPPFNSRTKLSFKENKSSVFVKTRKMSSPHKQTTSVCVSSLDLSHVYSDALASAPMLTKSVTSMMGFAIGDLVAQILSARKEAKITRFERNITGSRSGIISELDWQRTLRMALFGLIFFGPVSSEWYTLLDEIQLPQEIEGSSGMVVGIKTFLDQTVFSPIALSCFFAWDLAFTPSQPTTNLALPHYSSESRTIAGSTTTAVLLAPRRELNSLAAAISLKVRSDLWSTLKVNWTVWPILLFFNFTYVPSAYRVLYITVMQVFYNVFLCGQVSKKAELKQ